MSLGRTQNEVYAKRTRRMTDRLNGIQRWLCHQEDKLRVASKKSFIHPKSIKSTAHRKSNFVLRISPNDPVKNYDWTLLQNQRCEGFRDGLMRPRTIEKHIHPCMCDITPSHRRHIDKIENSRKISRAELYRRIERVREFLREQNRKENETHISKRARKEGQFRIEIEENNNEDEEDKSQQQVNEEENDQEKEYEKQEVYRKVLKGKKERRRELAQEQKLHKKKKKLQQKREHDANNVQTPKDKTTPKLKTEKRNQMSHIDKKTKKIIVRKIRKKKPPRRISNVSIKERKKLNWWKKPRFAISETRGSMLRKIAKWSYCDRKSKQLDVNEKFESLLPDVVRKKVRRAPTMIGSETRSSVLRLQVSTKRKERTEPQPKYKRAPFETSYRMMKYTNKLLT
ncbi:hypothetical protein PGB90_008646 [Kerria lacca]